MAREEATVARRPCCCCSSSCCCCAVAAFFIVVDLIVVCLSRERSARRASLFLWFSRQRLLLLRALIRKQAIKRGARVLSWRVPTVSLSFFAFFFFLETVNFTKNSLSLFRCNRKKKQSFFFK